MPGQRCSVLSCDNYLVGTRNKEVSYHRFPTETSIRLKWISKCGRSEDTINTKYARICSEHFTLQDFKRDLRAELMNTKPMRILEPNAVPSTNLPGTTEIKSRERLRTQTSGSAFDDAETKEMMSINFDLTRIKTEPVDDDLPSSNIFDVGQGLFRVKEEIITNDEPNLSNKFNDHQPVITFPTLSNLTKNPKSPVLEKTKYPCNLCPNWFRSLINLQRHKSLIHNEESACLCDQCGRSFKFRQDLHVHETFTHNKLTFGEYLCNHCQVIFLSQIDFENHNDRIHANLEPAGLFHSSVDMVACSSSDEQLLQCKVCALKFRTRANLSSHMLNFHNIEMASIINPTSPSYEMDEYSCAICNKVCENQESLEKHQASHLRVLPFVCDKCDFAAEFESQLIEHKAIHLSDSQNPLKCGYCSITFVEMAVMKQHMVISHCGKQSEKKKIKKARHSCDQCDAKFKSQSAMKYHKSNVHFNKVYHCYLCEFQFKTKLHLMYHKMRVHGDRTGINQRMYECNKCSKFFRSRAKIASHNKNHHGKLTSYNFNSDLILLECSDEDKVPQRGRPRIHQFKVRGRPRKHPNLKTSQTSIAYKHSEEQIGSLHNKRDQCDRKQSLVTTQEPLMMPTKYKLTPCVVQLERISNEKLQILVASKLTKTVMFQKMKPCFVRLKRLSKEIISSFNFETKDVNLDTSKELGIQKVAPAFSKLHDCL